MRLLRVLALNLLILFPFVTMAQSGLTGSWRGYIQLPGTNLIIKTHFKNHDDRLQGTIDIPQQMAAGIQLQKIYQGPRDSVRFQFPAGPGLAKFRGRFVNADSIAGTFYQNQRKFPFHMARVKAQPQASTIGPVPYVQKDIILQNGTVKIGGTLTLPEKKGPHACVVLLTGSGAQDRDENVSGFKIFRHIADSLTRRGIAVFRYDDRGVGESSGSLSGSTLSDLASDVGTIVDSLKQRSSIDPARIGLLGHSQGGIVASKVAAERDDIDFLVLMASPAFSLSEIVLQQLRAILDAAGVPDSVRQQNLRLQQEAFQAVRTHPNDLSAVQKKLEATVREEISQLPDEERQSLGNTEAYIQQQVQRQILPLKQPLFRSMLDYDPARDLEHLKVPVLALFGGRDLQVLAEPNRGRMQQLLTGDPQTTTLKVFKHANHLFQRAETGMPNEYGVLKPEFVEGFLDTITTWIHRQAS